jgi:hypothetical protein
VPDLGSNGQTGQDKLLELPEAQFRQRTYWLRVSELAGLREQERAGDDLGLPLRRDDFVMRWFGNGNPINPKPCEITARSAPSQFGIGRVVDASRSDVG